MSSDSNSKKLKFFLLSNKRKDADGSVVDKLKEKIESMGHVCECRDEGSNLENTKFLYTNPKDVPEDVDIIVVLGGDGTILQTSRDLHVLQKPILGVNIGTLGFLTDCEMDTVDEALERIIAGDYKIDHRTMISGKVIRDGEVVYEDFALNDIVINRRGSLRVIDFDVIVDDQFLNAYVADGLIISTATGSTAYALSAGGPIIEPTAKDIMITPICPHTLNARSIILDWNSEITVVMTDNKQLAEERVVTFDGETGFALYPGDKVVITKHPECAIFAKTSKISFLQRIRDKMMDH